MVKLQAQNKCVSAHIQWDRCAAVSLAPFGPLANPHSTAANWFCLLSYLHPHTRSTPLTITKISEKLPQQMPRGKLVSSAARKPASRMCSMDTVSRIIYLRQTFHASLSQGLAFPYLSEQLMFKQKPWKLKIILQGKRKNMILNWHLLKK